MIGSVNNDNKRDIILTNQGCNSVGILLNLVNGTFLPQFIPTVNSAFSSLALADINVDTKLDIIVGYFRRYNVNVRV